MGTFLVVFLLFLIFGISDMSPDERDISFWILGTISFVCLLWGKQENPPPPTIEDARKLLEKILKSPAALEDKKKAGALLELLDRMK
jgi:hypothetical protein